MGFKNLKYGDGRWFFVRAIMDEHLHKLLDRSYHVKDWKQTDFIGDVRLAAPSPKTDHKAEQLSLFFGTVFKCLIPMMCAQQHGGPLLLESS